MLKLQKLCLTSSKLVSDRPMHCVLIFFIILKALYIGLNEMKWNQPENTVRGDIKSMLTKFCPITVAREVLMVSEGSLGQNKITKQFF